MMAAARSKRRRTVTAMPIAVSARTAMMPSCTGSQIDVSSARSVVRMVVTIAVTAFWISSGSMPCQRIDDCGLTRFGENRTDGNPLPTPLVSLGQAESGEHNDETDELQGGGYGAEHQPADQQHAGRHQGRKYCGPSGAEHDDRAGEQIDRSRARQQPLHHSLQQALPETQRDEAVEAYGNPVDRQDGERHDTPRNGGAKRRPPPAP